MNFTTAEHSHYRHGVLQFFKQKAHGTVEHPRIWRQLRNKQLQKRSAHGKRSRESIEAKDEIILQRMSSEVTGKQQKYTRIGPREFVPFKFDDNL